MCQNGWKFEFLDESYWASSFLPYLLIYLLTYSMVHSSSWEANWFAASQEIPRVSRYPKVHYRTHKRPPTVSILGQPSPVHIPTSHFLEIHPNIIHPSTLRSPQWSPSLRFPHQDPIHPHLLTNTRHMSSPSHSRFYHPHNIGASFLVTFRGIRQIINVLILGYRQTDERLPHKSFVFTFVSNA